MTALSSEHIENADTTSTETTYEYDTAHNRTKKTVDTVETSYHYNSLNQLVSANSSTGQTTYGYDDNGNRLTRKIGPNTDLYSYDFENRLTALTKTTTGGEGNYEYTYDYRTRRVYRAEAPTNGPNVETQIVFSGGTSIQEIRQGNTPELAVEYIRGSDYGGGIGGILYTIRDSTPSFTHYNHRGDIVSKTDDNGIITYEAQYEAFGTRLAESGATEDRQKANTKDEDPTGLLNEGFRYRDLETGTFLTRDPLGFVDGPNMRGGRESVASWIQN